MTDVLLKEINSFFIFFLVKVNLRSLKWLKILQLFHIKFITTLVLLQNKQIFYIFSQLIRNQMFFNDR